MALRQKTDEQTRVAVLVMQFLQEVADSNGGNDSLAFAIEGIGSAFELDMTAGLDSLNPGGTRLLDVVTLPNISSESSTPVEKSSVETQIPILAKLKNVEKFQKYFEVVKKKGIFTGVEEGASVLNV